MRELPRATLQHSVPGWRTPQTLKQFATDQSGCRCTCSPWFRLRWEHVWAAMSHLNSIPATPRRWCLESWRRPLDMTSIILAHLFGNWCCMPLDGSSTSVMFSAHGPAGVSTWCASAHRMAPRGIVAAARTRVLCPGMPSPLRTIKVLRELRPVHQFLTGDKSHSHKKTRGGSS
jgi:hypothetical protein